MPPDPIYSLSVFKRFVAVYRGFFVLISGAVAVSLIVAGLRWIGVHYGKQVQTLSFVGNLLLILVGLFLLLVAGAALWAHIERLASPYLPPDIKGVTPLENEYTL